MATQPGRLGRGRGSEALRQGGQRALGLQVRPDVIGYCMVGIVAAKNLRHRIVGRIFFFVDAGRTKGKHCGDGASRDADPVPDMLNRHVVAELEAASDSSDRGSEKRIQDLRSPVGTLPGVERRNRRSIIASRNCSETRFESRVARAMASEMRCRASSISIACF